MRNRRPWRWLALSVFLAGAVLVLHQSTVHAQLPRLILNEIYADFGVGADQPLVKTKFNVYDPDIPTLQQLDDSIEKLNDLNIDTYRIEVCWGRRRQGFGTNNSVKGTAEKLEYDFTAMDHMAQVLDKHNIRFHAAWGYTPTPLQEPNSQSNGTLPPKDVAKWKEVMAAFANHYKEMGLRFGLNEIWNEPDGTRAFYTGTEAEYQKLYIAAVEALRAADPDAIIGGPASAPEMVWHLSFPEFIAKNNLPLDQYTFHHYGSSELALRSVREVVASLNRFPQLNTVAMNLDEWFDGDCCTWCGADVRQTYEGASQMLHDFNVLLGKPELPLVSWAWWLDPGPRPQPPAGQPPPQPAAGRGAAAGRGGDGGGAGRGCMGLLTGDGHRKAVYNAWKMYAMMPVDRKQVRIEGPLETMASADNHNAGLLFWNRDPYERRVDVHFSNVPFARGTVKVYRVDATHASIGDGASDVLEPVETFADVDMKDWKWIDKRIPKFGTVYIEAEDGTGLSELIPVNTAKFIRVNRYFPARGKTQSYSDFDRKTWIARLGMADEQQADQKIGVLAEQLPDSLTFAAKVDGKLHKVDANSLLGVRVDYSVKGAYAKGVLFHGPYGGISLYNPARTAGIPWGLKQKPDDTVAVADLAKFRVDLKKYAPAGWSGKAHITFIMQNAGPGTRAKITVRPGA